MAKSSRKKVSVTSPSEDDEAAINRGVEVETRERVWMDGTRVPDAETRRGFARRRRDAVSADAALDTARACIGASGCGACCWRSSIDTAGQEVGRELKRFSQSHPHPSRRAHTFRRAVLTRRRATLGTRKAPSV
jgi:hypothetical protein